MTSIEAVAANDNTTGMRPRQYFLNTPFDSIEHDAVVTLMAQADPGARFRYVVTPNADHVVRLNSDPSLRMFYDAAWLTLCDSRPISLFARSRSRQMTHVTGSDLTVSLFQSVIGPGDRIAVIASGEKVVNDLRAAFPGVDFRVHIPPMGLWSNPDAQRDCIEFAVRERGRFLFITVGAPQSEKIAYLVSQQPSATGIALCVGASLEFLVGTRKRAPSWMRRMSLEWLHRLATEPKRMWRRYVYGVVPLVRLFSIELRSRRVPAPAADTSAQK